MVWLWLRVHEVDSTLIKTWSNYGYSIWAIFQQRIRRFKTLYSCNLSFLRFCFPTGRCLWNLPSMKCRELLATSAIYYLAQASPGEFQFARCLRGGADRLEFFKLLFKGSLEEVCPRKSQSSMKVVVHYRTWDSPEMYKQGVIIKSRYSRTSALCR